MILHELLVALNGYDGEIFVKDSTTNVVSVQKNSSFIKPSEEVTLNHLCKLATYYIKFKSFIEQTTGSFDSTVGLYKRRFADGLEQCLVPYLELLIEIEGEILADPYWTITHVVTRTEKYQLIFPKLSELVDKVSKNEVYGCAILDMLYKASVCGMPEVKEAVLKILKFCHRTMYTQLLYWMLYGRLGECSNSEAEFFIKYRDDTETTAVRDGRDGNRTNEKDGGGDADANVEDKIKSDDITGSNHIPNDTRQKSGDNFTLDINLLPSYIPLDVAEKILFIGRSVVLFRSSSSRDGTLLNKDATSELTSNDSIIKSHEKEFKKDIDMLSKMEVFDSMRFESTIDKIRTYVAEQLCTLIVDQSDLKLHLRRFKDFFLIGRGELFLAFIDQSQNLLRKPPTKATEHDINFAFKHAMRNVLLSEEISKWFSFVIEEPTAKTTLKTHQQSPQMPSSSRISEPSSFLNTRESGWNCLKMTACVEWPLHVMFTPSVIKKYSTLFSFLFRVKRIQLELHQCWAIDMQRRHLASNERICQTESSAVSNRFHGDALSGSPSIEAMKWRLRNHMAFIIDNLQYYLQVDVIESQYSLLVEKINTKKDFEQIIYAHECFLASLLNQCFLHSKHISNCLSGILDLCHKFYGFVVYSENEPSVMQQAQLQDMIKEFDRHSDLLFMILSSVRNSQASNPHLAQLLLRIDYNNYFSHSRAQLSSNPTTK